MSYFEKRDPSPFDRNRTDEVKINGGHAVPCRICEDQFGVETLTTRYCKQCGRGFCEGTHGSYSQMGGAIGVCVVCNLAPKYSPPS
jgi:hypothetical protein